MQLEWVLCSEVGSAAWMLCCVAWSEAGCYVVQGVRHQGVMLLVQLPLARVTFPDGDLTERTALIT